MKDYFAEDYRVRGPEQSFEVHEAENTPRATGLLDHRGRPLVSAERKEPIGFVMARIK